MRINNNYEFGGIRIYKDGEILFKTDRGYLEVKKLSEDNTKVEGFYSNGILNFNLQNEIKRAVKLNLNRTDNFYIKEKLENSYPSVKQVLYIHASEIEVIALGEIIAMQTAEEINYIDTYKFIFKNGYSIQKMTLREIPSDYQFKNKYEIENHINPQIGKNKGKHFIKEYMAEEQTEAIITGDYYTRKDESKNRLEAKAITEEFKNILPYANLSHYDVEKLLKHYNITKKEQKNK